jgi:hypothetical protein
MPFHMRSGHARRGSTPFAESNGSLAWSSNASTPPSPKKKFALPWSKKRSPAPLPPIPAVPTISKGIVDSNSSSTVSTALSSAFDTDGSSTTSLSSPETSPQKTPPQVAKFGHRVRAGVLQAGGTAGKALHEVVRQTPPRVANVLKFEHSPPFDPSFELAARRYSEDADDESEGLCIRPSPSFDPSIIGATFLGGSAAPSTLGAPSSFSRIPSIHVEGLSMDDVFRELEEKMGVRLDHGGASDAQLVEAVNRVSRRLSSMGQLNGISAKSLQRLSYLTEPTSLAYATDLTDDTCEKESPPQATAEPYKRDAPSRQTAKPYKAPVRTSSRRQASSGRPKRKALSPISVSVANSVSLPDDCKSPMSMQDFSIFSPRPDKNNTSALQGLGPPFSFADAVSGPPSAPTEDRNADLPTVFVLPPTPEIGGGGFGAISKSIDDSIEEMTDVAELPAPENFDAPPIVSKSSRRRRDSIRIQKNHRRRPTCSTSPESTSDPYTPPLSPATSSSTVSSFDSPIAPCFPQPPASQPMPTSSVSVVSEGGMEAEELLNQMFARLCQPHTPPRQSSSPWRETNRSTSAMSDDGYQYSEHRQGVVQSSGEAEGLVEGSAGEEDEDDFGQFADAPSVPDFGVYTKSTPPPRVIVTSPSSDFFLSSTAAHRSINHRSPSNRSLPSEYSVSDELADLDEAVVTVCERRHSPGAFEVGVAM